MMCSQVAPVLAPRTRKIYLMVDKCPCSVHARSEEPHRPHINNE